MSSQRKNNRKLRGPKRGARCAYCHEQMRLANDSVDPNHDPFVQTVDHIIPQSQIVRPWMNLFLRANAKVVANSPLNTVLACRRCNQEKKNMLPKEYTQKTGKKLRIPTEAFSEEHRQILERNIQIAQFVMYSIALHGDNTALRRHIVRTIARKVYQQNLQANTDDQHTKEESAMNKSKRTEKLPIYYKNVREQQIRDVLMFNTQYPRCLAQMIALRVNIENPIYRQLIELLVRTDPQYNVENPDTEMISRAARDEGSNLAKITAALQKFIDMPAQKDATGLVRRDLDIAREFCDELRQITQNA